MTARAITIANASKNCVSMRIGVPPTSLRDSEGTARSLL